MSGTATVGEQVLHQALEEIAAESPERELACFVPEGEPLLAGILFDRARAMASGLAQSGVACGDRVLIVVGNRAEFLVSWFACSMMGALSVPVNTALRGDVLDHVVRQVEPVAAIVESEFLSQARPSLRAHAAQAQLVVTDGGDIAPGELSWEELEDGGQLFEPLGARPSDACSIMYTSGTTGPSKGVIFTHGTAFALASSSVEVMGHNRDDVAFTCLPLFHSNALFTTFLPAMVQGGTSVIASRFSAQDFWSQVSRSEATLVNMLGSIAPILMQREPSAEERDHRVRLGLVIPPPPGGLDVFEKRFGFPATELYGLTDVGIPIGVPHGSRKPGSCGRALSDWECWLVDDADRPVTAGQVGELVCRPLRPNIMSAGYWRMAEATVEAWRNLCMHTGDLLRQDDEGWFSFVDRDKDAIRRSGENISSYEVEQSLLSHPGVEEVAVFAVPSDLAEDEVMAVVVPKVDGSPLTPEELLAHCEPRLPYFAVPRYLELIEELPRTQTAKIRKAVLRERGVVETTFDAGPRGRRARMRAQETEATTQRG